MSNPMDDAPEWRFVRAGDFEQVILSAESELLALGQLDKKLWAALSCPVHGLEFDTRTLSLIDNDNDDRIRVPEILEAIRFSRALLKNLDGLLEGKDALPLDLIDDSHEEGEKVLAAAWHLLAACGRDEALVIRLEDVVDAQAELAKLPFNGDGIVPPVVADTEGLRNAMEELIACVGGELDRSGELGISSAKVVQFFSEIEEHLTWLKEAQQSQAILPLGSDTAPAYEALQRLRDKIDDYFVRCNLAAFDARATLPLNRAEEDFAVLAPQSLSFHDEAIAAFPLAAIEAGGALPLGHALNPAWSGAMAEFNRWVVVPLLGQREELTQAEWQTLQGRFTAYGAWLATKRGALVEVLGEERLHNLLAGDIRSQMESLIAQDQALFPEYDALDKVERLVRYQRDLMLLLNNFVTFADFYSGDKSIFQAGTLYIDQRSCDLCLRIDDVAKHVAMAALSQTYLLYCECRRQGGNEKMTIAAAVTAGEVDNLMVGRNGLFIDRQGRDWDATVVKVIEQPISIRQAFFAPYRRLGRFIGAQLEKMASSREKSVDTSMAAGVEGGTKSAESGRAPVAPFDVAKFAGIFAAIGLAIGALGTAIVALVTGLLSLAWWQIPLALAAILLLISGPAMVIAWLKLRHRNLAPLLDGNGWAVNTRARINIPFGTSLTALAQLPSGTGHPMNDPFAKSKHHWGVYLLVALIVVVAIVFKWLRHG